MHGRTIVTALILCGALILAPGAAPRLVFAGDMDLPVHDSAGAAVEEEPADEDQETLPEEDEPPKFYDEEIPDLTDSVIYVVDRSSSMTLPARSYVGLDGQPVTDGTRLDFVKTELIRSIQSLPTTFTFNIVIYSECVETWRPARQPASAAMKATAIAWIHAIQPWGWTNTGGGTERALEDRGNKVVMLLSDGAPNFLDCSQSTIGDFDTHRRVIKTGNVQDAVIHCFGIGLDAETRAFMMQVAQENGGTFRELD